MTNQYALGYKAGLEAAVKVCDKLYKHDRKESGYDEGWNDALDIAEQTIAAMPVPEVQWRDLTDDEIEEVCISLWSGGWRQKAMNDFARAVIAKLKEVNK